VSHPRALTADIGAVFVASLQPREVSSPRGFDRHSAITSGLSWIKVVMIDRFIFTGPPGAGKTTVLRQLAEEGFATVDEAATDVIAAWQQQGIDEAWTYPSFVDAIVEIQRQRQVNLGDSARIQFYDRSPICTLALAEWLGHPVSDALRFEIARIRHERDLSA
jgi:predicted ATPase